MARDKQEQEQERQLPSPKTKRPHEEQPTGDYSQGHPGVPPKNYEAPKESRR